MHKFAELNSDRAALLFADYCTMQGLAVHAVVQSHQSAALYAEAEQLTQVEAEFSRFLTEPDHPRYQSAAWQRSQVNERIATERSVHIPWYNVLQQPVTLLVTVICLLVYGWQQLNWQQALHVLLLSDPQQLWRWFTPALLHFSLMHLVFNLAWWFVLGRQFEQRLGGFQLLSLMLSVAVLSNAAQYMMAGGNFGGLSGVVYGLFGYFWVAGRINPAQGLTISNGLVGFIVVWMLLGFFDVLWLNMANWAHLAGLVAGMVWAVLLRRHPGKNGYY
ncbi:rhomboid family intramembrane serine protease GlpG [Chromatiaceae bacterium AAb-1]|nr:rhomboid family intramembrane serine protease GlpG [Chromatiaceae bacterium AAb-1]